jgi:long-chain acyl-CoA synthetase
MAAEPAGHPGRTIARLARQVELAVSGLELTLSQYRVLGILGDGQEAASVLADKLAVSRPSITGVVDGLVARGLVCRDHGCADRRRVDVGLTDQGRRVLTAADAEVERRLTEIAGYLERDSRAARPGTHPGGPTLAATSPPKSPLGGGRNEPFASLDPWRAALDSYRTARHAKRTGANVGR